jgi:hypothetical protein
MASVIPLVMSEVVGVLLEAITPRDLESRCSGERERSALSVFVLDRYVLEGKDDLDLGGLNVAYPPTSTPIRNISRY